MPEIKYNFLQGKMNQDIDDRVLPNGEYRSAQNIQVTTSEESDIGSIQNLLGNVKVSTDVFPPGGPRFGFLDLETIGVFFDEKNKRIYYFVTNYTCSNPDAVGLVGGENGPFTATQIDNGDLFCGIYLYDVDQNTTKLLVSGLFLNFSKTNTITGVNLIDKLLFFTDGLNQPRRINIEKAIDRHALHPTPYYTDEDKISVAKFAPFMPPLLLDYETTTLNNNPQQTTTGRGGTLVNVDPTSSMQTNSSFPDDLIEEKFVRFSYRYRFVDGEYSTIAPFTQVCFIPKTSSLNAGHMQKILKQGEVYFQSTDGSSDGMVNSVNSVNLNIILPSKKLTTDFDIDAIEILYKESNNNVIRAVELIEIENENASDLATEANSSNFSQNEGVFQYKYKSTLPYKTLPPNQLPRVYDNVPLSAKAQEIVGNRVIYGNFVQERTLPSEKGIVGLNFNTNVDAKYDTTNPLGNADFNNYYLHKEYPFHSIKSRRTYEVGVVLSDKFGRQSPVLTSTIGDGSITVDAKSRSFNSSTWSSDDSLTIQNTTPGNENYCGDALTITFNKTIPNAYAKGTFIGINQGIERLFYANDLFKLEFRSQPNFTTADSEFILGDFFYYSSSSIGQPDSATDFIYANVFLTEKLTGQSFVYARTASSSIDSSSNISGLEIELNPTTGAVLNISPTAVAISDDLVEAQSPVLTANSGDAYSESNIENQATVTFSEVEENFVLTISNTSFSSLFSVGDYLKGQDKDFVKIISIQISSINNNINLTLDGKPSLSYIVDENNVPLGYSFFKYKIVPHGWYSYRVVVKQTEQDYHNVYAPGVFDFDNDRDDHKTYLPIIGDNVNKVTRDREFSNTQEVGLSTSKDKLFPKVIPSEANKGISLQSNNDILDVVSIGTAKEQGITNEQERVLAFIPETDKNPLIAQIPFGGSASSNIGSNTEAGLLGTTIALTVETDPEAGSFTSSNPAPLETIISDSKKLLKIQGGNTSQTNFPTIGDYLKGASKDLVKIIKITSADPVIIECDGEISDDYKSVKNGENIRIYNYKYGVQDNLAVFETKPVESVLDIYYETSTAGLVHELNEALSVPSKVTKVLFDSTFSEDVLYVDIDTGEFQNEYAAIVEYRDELDNNISSTDITEVAINSIRAFAQRDPSIISGNSASFNFESQVAQDLIITDANDMPFEIVFVDSEWKIKPKQNFYHSVFEDQQHNAFEFNLTVTHQGNTETTVLENELVILSLENKAPVVVPSINIENSVPTVQETNEFSVVGQISATNGSADTNNNKKGLIFYSRYINPLSISTENTITITNPINQQELVIEANTALYDNDGETVIPDLKINNQNGEISIRTECFTGFINKTFDIYVYDSDTLIFDSDEYNQDDSGLFFGKRSLVTVNVKVTADLIVIEGSQNDDSIHHPYYNPTGGNSLNGVNIFKQDEAINRDSDQVNGYWTENPTNEIFFGMSQNDMQAALRRPASGELYLWGYYMHHATAIDINDIAGTIFGRGNAYCWSIGVDELTGEPFVHKYQQLREQISSLFSFFWLNSVMKYRIRGRLRTIGDIVVDMVKSESVLPGDLAEGDITGENNTGIGIAEDNFTSTDIRDLLETNDTQWNFNTLGFGPFGGNNPQQGQGSFEYYGINSDEPTGSVVKPEHRGLDDSHMYQANQTVNIQGHEYFVVYEISNIRASYVTGDDVEVGGLPVGGTAITINKSYLSKVFLCRKKQ